MSTDYSKMSDTEVAQKVFFWLSNDFCPNGGLAHINKDGFFFFDNGNVKRKFDPCNNPADAWPIIAGNEISLISRCANGEWKAQLHLGKDDIFDNYASCWDKKPLKAAMIVFLMMQESKNAS